MANTRNTRTRSNARAATNSGKRPSIGASGETALEMLFRFGGANPEQFMALMDMQDTIARRTLSRLEANGYVTTTADFARYLEKNALNNEQARGRPPEYYYLTPAGIDYAGQLAGAEDSKEARAAYKRHGLPGLAAHSSIENRVLLAAVKAAGEAEGWTLTTDDCVCESALDYPLLTGAKKSAKSSQVRLLYPDGEFFAMTPAGKSVYMLEVESGLRPRRLLLKIEDYASWMLAAEQVRPLIIVGLSETQASSMRRAAKEALDSSSGEWKKWEKLLARKARGRDAAAQVDARALIGFAELRDLEISYRREGIEAPVFETLLEARGEAIWLSLEHLATLASEAREMVYGVKEVS